MEAKLIFRTQSTGLTRRDTLNGKEYLVVPVVAVREGVLNGEYLSAIEIEASVRLWEDVPIPVYHPLRNGAKVSAKNLSVIKEDVIGRFYNAYYDDNALKGELWLDIEQATAIGGEALAVVNRLIAGEMVEVSTAYFASVTLDGGIFNGIEYSGAQGNIRPDHLALLPEKIGACSVADGCGANRVNESTDPVAEEIVSMKTQEATSNESIIGKIKHLLGVKRMNTREEAVQALRENGVDLADGILETADEAILNWMVTNSAPVVEESQEAEAVVAVEEAIVEEVAPASAETPDASGAVTVNEYLESKGTDLKAVVAHMKAQEDAEKAKHQELVDQLVGNDSCTLAPEVIAEMDDRVLLEMNELYKPGTYVGVGLPRENAGEVPVAPSVVTNTTKVGE